MLGYDRTELAALPAANTAAFAGLGNPLAAGVLSRGETVLDVGCGAGTDLLLAALRIGPTGKALGIDMTASMRDRAMEGARAMGMRHVQILGRRRRPAAARRERRRGDLERRPEPRYG